ncbi:MAG: type II toxin-antitoxin system VapC family toxin [Deltaproteobacteria bacterium]
MKYLLDTNIISEIRKGPRCHPNVAAWYSNLEEESLYLSVLVLGEIRKGIEGLRDRDAGKANELDLWLEQLQTSFQSQILPVDTAISQEWGRLSSLHTVPVIDGLLAATATAHRLVLVTRNTRDFADLGIQLLNPFETRNLV